MKKGTLKGAAAAVFALWAVAALAAPANDNSAPSPVPAKQTRLADAVENAKRATVGILRNYTNRKDYDHPVNLPHEIRSSGVHIGEGYILASRHGTKEVVEWTDKMPERIFILNHRAEELTAYYVGDYRDLDIALYRVDLSAIASLPAAVPFSASEPEAGEEVFTVGYPSDWGRIISFGHTGDREKYLSTAETRLIQIDMSACSGNSGGGMFNRQGEVVAMMQSIIATGAIMGEHQCSHQSFAIPGPSIARAVEDMKQGRQPDFSRLGVSMEPALIKLRNAWRVAVMDVSGPAQKAGIEKGDILLSIDGVSITSPEQLKSYLIEKTRPGQESRIEFIRKGQERSAVVTLEHP